MPGIIMLNIRHNSSDFFQKFVQQPKKQSPENVTDIKVHGTVLCTVDDLQDSMRRLQQGISKHCLNKLNADSKLNVYSCCHADFTMVLLPCTCAYGESNGCHSTGGITCSRQLHFGILVLNNWLGKWCEAAAKPELPHTTAAAMGSCSTSQIIVL